MQKLSLVKRFLTWFWQAKTKYQVHSPFFYDFVTEILEDKRQYYAFSELEDLRNLLLTNRNTLEVTDLGAGSYTQNQNERRISAIAKTSLTSPFFCRILFKMVNHYHAGSILELGTSLGLTSLYLASANPKAKVYTLEGCPNLSRFAKENFAKMKTDNIEVITGEFSNSLPKLLKNIDQLDFIFIDGNHRYKPTVNYFEMCLEKSHEKSIFIFDDIYWSEEMVRAWKDIKNHPSTRATIDLFFMGIVFLRTENKTVEHFKLAPASWKPWVVGFLK